MSKENTANEGKVWFIVNMEQSLFDSKPLSHAQVDHLLNLLPRYRKLPKTSLESEGNISSWNLAPSPRKDEVIVFALPAGATYPEGIEIYIVPIKPLVWGGFLRVRDPQYNALTIQEIMSELGVSERTVRYWLDKGKMVGERHGRVWSISVDAFRDFLARHKKYKPETSFLKTA